MRRSIVVAVAVLAVAFVFVGGPSLFASPSTSDVAPEHEDQPRPDVVSFEDSESGFWPYLNAREVHEKRSPINVVVRGDTDEIVRVLTERADADWETLEAEEAQSGTYGFFADHQYQPTGVEWGETTGATRYAWVDPADDEPEWVTETLQVEDGDYYGQRYHIRLYESPRPDDGWVAMQTHTEHFDWFTLRHRVDGVEAAQLELERDFMSIPGVDNRSNVTRINLENAGPSDADGWATLIDLTGAAAVPAALAGVVAARRRTGHESHGESRRRSTGNDYLTDVDRARIAAVTDRIAAGHLILAATILALLLGVRLAGVALERHVDVLSMHAIAALLYPVIGLGLPIATYAIASGLRRRLDAALAASISLAVAIWLDYGLLGVDSLPIDVVVHRMLVVVALGLIAAGAARRAIRDSRFNEMVIVGSATWVVVLGGTLFGYF